MQSINSKILLFGEYTVLHNSMALVMPCELYSGQLSFYDSATNKTYALKSNEYLKKFSEFVKSCVDEEFALEVKMFERELENGLFFQSNIPQGYGLGSSGALVAAIFLRYLKITKNIKDDIKLFTFGKMLELKRVLGQLESYFHGVSSGIDPLSALVNEPLLVKNSEEIETTVLPKKNKRGKNVIFLLDSHTARNTSGLMNKFNALQRKESFNKRLKNDLVYHNNEAISNFLNNDVNAFYKNVYEISSFQLNEMSDFIPESLQSAVRQGLEDGDYLLKLCGAGGGGFMLGFTQDWKKTSESLKDFDIKEIYRY